MKSEFVFYPTTLDDVPHSIRVDIYAHEVLDDNPHGAIIMVPYDAKEDGYPRSEEYERLNSLEDFFIGKMLEQDARLMGAITGNGTLDLFFACSTAEALKEALSDIHQDAYEVVVQPEGAEGLYVQYLYPNAFEQQYIANQDYCKQLLDQGELFETARDVVFFASFHDNESAHAFAHEFESVTKEAHIHLAQDGHIHVHLTLNIIPDVMTVNLLTDKMVNLTAKSKGHFEGWQTTVVSE